MVTSMRDFASFSKLRSAIGREKMDMQFVAISGLAILSVIMPLELSQLSFAVVGAVVYAALQGMRRSTQSSLRTKSMAKHMAFDVDEKKAETKQPRPWSKAVAASPTSPKLGGHVARPRSDSSKRALQAANEIGKPDYKQQSVQPVSAPSFIAEDFDGQVKDLVDKISPSAEGDVIVRKLVCAARKALQHLFPEAEIAGFASGDVTRGTAFGVAIPAIDLVLNVRPSVIAERLQNRASRPFPQASKLDGRGLHKAALRACTDELVSVGGFKFRRSAFKGHEPKVTVLAPSSMGIHSDGVPVDFSVNTVSPFYNAALLAESGQIDARAKELILLVRRWAKDRGISHAAKGHLCPYAWTVLAIYFLQVSTSEPEAILPALSEFKLSSELLGRKHTQNKSSVEEHKEPSRKPISKLFQEFFEFYNTKFDWRKEAVALLHGTRAPPDHSFPLLVLLDENRSTVVAPSVADPFVRRQNLASNMTVLSVARLREEMARAYELCSRHALLSELLDPWVPAERCTGPLEDGE
eukprot:TRINITY_DN2067_c0_g1_i14.p1 TRINITY_DN2067_c0_g1~~TRINITY_DN2067_c0_g1_i14.p1  ORF type:complete len:524 (-),score=79.44 TRINITY_DN2067_c0_g1_i14:139-1710(-)